MVSKFPSPIVVNGDVAMIRIESPTHGTHVIVLDAVDVPAVERYRWHVHRSPAEQAFYARAWVDGRKVEMHRLLLGFPTVDIDHVDHNGLNNRLSNLRLATQSQNQANRRIPKNNSSGVKGVHWNARAAKWQVQIRHQYKRRYLGLFTSIEDAKAAYLAASRQLFGEFAET